MQLCYWWKLVGVEFVFGVCCVVIVWVWEVCVCLLFYGDGDGGVCGVFGGVLIDCDQFVCFGVDGWYGECELSDVFFICDGCFEYVGGGVEFECCCGFWLQMCGGYGCGFLCFEYGSG